MYRRTALGLACTALCALLACSRKPPQSKPTQILKLKVLQDGTIILDDKKVTVDELESSLSKLRQAGNGGVWYYRENAGAKPHPNAIAAIKSVIDARLPVRLSTKPDFSDSIGPNDSR